MAPNMLEAVEDDLEKALEETEDDDVRYHIRQAAQRVVVAQSNRKR